MDEGRIVMISAIRDRIQAYVSWLYDKILPRDPNPDRPSRWVRTVNANWYVGIATVVWINRRLKL